MPIYAQLLSFDVHTSDGIASAEVDGHVTEYFTFHLTFGNDVDGGKSRNHCRHKEISPDYDLTKMIRFRLNTNWVVLRGARTNWNATRAIFCFPTSLGGWRAKFEKTNSGVHAC